MDVDTSSTTSSTNPKTKKDGNVTPSASGDAASKYPDMSLAQSIHKLTMMSGSKPQLTAKAAASIGIPSDLNETVMKAVGGEEVENPSLYRHLKSVLSWTDDACLSDADLSALDDKHKTTMASMEAEVEEAKENAGDMEVLDARFEIARFAAKSLSKEEALEAYEKVLALPKLSSGKTMDALMESARVASFHGDVKKNAELIEKVSCIAVFIFLLDYLQLFRFFHFTSSCFLLVDAFNFLPKSVDCQTCS